MATKGKKNAKVKWAIGGVEPDDLPDFQSNDDIIRKNKGALPAKGRTRILVKKITSKANKNGDQMLTVTAEIAEGTAKKPGSHDGYAMWERLNVTEQGAPYLKRFLTAVGVTWNDFINKTVADESDEKFSVITKIGSVKFDKPVVAYASIKHGVDNNDEEVAEIGRFMPPPEDEDDEPDDAEDDDDDEDDEDIEEADDEDADDDDEDSDDDEDEDSDEDDDEDDEDGDDEDDDEDAEAALREELDDLKLPALKKRAIRAGADADDIPAKKGKVIDLIVELELEDSDDDDEDDDDDDDRPDPDELKAELKGLDLTELRNRARANGRKATDLKGAKKPALIAFILEDEIPPF